MHVSRSLPLAPILSMAFACLSVRARAAEMVEPLPPPLHFGAQGQVVLSGSLSASIGHLGYGSSDAYSNSFTVAPGFDYFLVRNVLVGAGVSMQASKSRSGIGVEATSTGLGVSGHLGVNVPMGDWLSWRPLASLSVWKQHSVVGAPQSGFRVSYDGLEVPIAATSSEVNESALVLSVFAPLLIHPAPHFFLGFGPDFYVDLLHSVGDAVNRRTFLGLTSTLGGWF